jgi:hypothetical protein
MNLRRLSSVCLFVSTSVVTVTGITLYFNIGGHRLSLVPHIYFSIPFVIALLLHIIINFKTFAAYLKGKTMGLSKELWINVTIAVAFVLISAYVFNKTNVKSPYPYPAVEKIPLGIVLEIEGVDEEKAIQALIKAGYTVPAKDSGDLTLRDISAANQVNPRLIYTVMTADLQREQ